MSATSWVPFATPAPVPAETAVSAPPGAASRVEEVIRLLAATGIVTGKMRHSAQAAVAAAPAEEPILGAWRCGIAAGTTGREGVAVLTPRRLSVFDRRGFRSVDQRLHLPLGDSFSLLKGPAAGVVTIAGGGSPPVALDLLDASWAEAFVDQVEAQRASREEGWWSAGGVAWPGWLGDDASWSYLGGDPALRGHADGLRVEVGPAGVTLGDTEGATAHLTGWSRVASLQVLGREAGLARAASRTLLVSEAFAAAWRSAEWSAFLVVGYAGGEEVFLGTPTLPVAWLRSRLVPVAAAMPGTPEAEARPEAEASEASLEAKASEARLEPEAGLEGTAPAAAEEPPAVPDMPVAAAGPDAGPADLAGQLERLATLHQRGLLDDAEFARAKAALLRG